jgi:predicted permease
MHDRRAIVDHGLGVHVPASFERNESARNARAPPAKTATPTPIVAALCKQILQTNFPRPERFIIFSSLWLEPGPQLIGHSLFLLGHASGGVALFGSGVALASCTIRVNGYVLFLVFLKNIVQPALVLGGLRWLDYGNPIVSKAVLTTAIPSMPMVILLAVQYRAGEAEIASAVFLSVIGSVITMAAFIALTS